MTYMTEIIRLADMDAQCNVLALDGWQLFAALLHPNQADNEDPRVITIWQK